jgi:hypothetical protein
MALISTTTICIVFDPLRVSLPIVCHQERLNIRDLFRSKTDVGRRSVAPREGNRPEAIDNVESACKRFDRGFVAETGSCAFGPADDNAANLRAERSVGLTQLEPFGDREYSKSQGMLTNPGMSTMSESRQITTLLLKFTRAPAPIAVA